MFGGILRLVGTLGRIVSQVLGKHGRYIPGLDEVVDILDKVGPIVAASDHPEAAMMVAKIDKVLENKKVV